MSQRHLTEMGRSTNQLLASLVQDVGRLKNSVYQTSGAMRTASIESTVDSGSIPTTILSLELSRGRWLAMFRTTLFVQMTSGASFHWRFNIPSAEYVSPNTVGMFVMPVEGAVRQPICDFTEFRLEEPDVAELQLWQVSPTGPTWLNTSFFCLPL